MRLFIILFSVIFLIKSEGDPLGALEFDINTVSNLIAASLPIKTSEEILFFDPLKEEVVPTDFIVTPRRERQLDYIEKYLPLAKEEKRKYKIPVSITLAQGLLESNIGDSRLATENNNHFGIKCFSRTCRRGHCTNFNDDHHKDFFRKFNTVGESFHAHSKLLQKPRYNALFKLKITDYKGWAHGLKKAGYATDPRYGPKLIRIIEDLDLHKYD